MIAVLIGVFAAAVWALSRWFGRQEDEGNFDAKEGPVGLRRFFDYRRDGGWRDRDQR